MERGREGMKSCRKTQFVKKMKMRYEENAPNTKTLLADTHARETLGNWRFSGEIHPVRN